jgi:hypothetical protein
MLFVVQIASNQKVNVATSIKKRASIVKDALMCYCKQLLKVALTFLV